MEVKTPPRLMLTVWVEPVAIPRQCGIPFWVTTMYGVKWGVHRPHEKPRHEGGFAAYYSRSVANAIAAEQAKIRAVMLQQEGTMAKRTPPNERVR